MYVSLEGLSEFLMLLFFTTLVFVVLTWIVSILGVLRLAFLPMFGVPLVHGLTSIALGAVITATILFMERPEGRDQWWLLTGVGPMLLGGATVAVSLAHKKRRSGRP